MHARTLAIVGVIFFSFLKLSAQISLLGTYSESFDSMGVSGTSTPAHWSVTVGGDSNGSTTVTPRFTTVETSGSVNDGLNAGTISGSDRWLGYYAGAPGDDRKINVSFSNNSGVAITQLNIEYDMKLWVNRLSANRWGGLTLEYSSDNTNWVSMGTSFSGSLTNNGLSASSSPYWVNNGPELSNLGGTYVLPSSIANGSTFYLRWNGNNSPIPSGYNTNDRKNVGIAINDFKLSINHVPIAAIPEPKTYLFLLLTFGIVIYRYRKSLR